MKDIESFEDVESYSISYSLPKRKNTLLLPIFSKGYTNFYVLLWSQRLSLSSERFRYVLLAFDQTECPLLYASSCEHDCLGASRLSSLSLRLLFFDGLPILIYRGFTKKNNLTKKASRRMSALEIFYQKITRDRLTPYFLYFLPEPQGQGSFLEILLIIKLYISIFY